MDDQNPQQANPVVSLLLKSPLTPTQRRAASEAFSAAANEDDLVTRMEGMNLPKTVMADLWDLKVTQGPQPAGEMAGPEGSALARFGSNLGEMINPVTIAEGLYNTVRHPIETGKNILAASNDQRLKAHDAQAQGNYGEMAARSVAAALPIVGPMAANIGEQLGSGDVAGAAGAMAGLAAPMGLSAVMRGRSASKLKRADALEREAVQTVAQKVLAPKDRKYQPAAQNVAPKLLERGVQGDRVAVQQWADDLIADAQTRIDDVINSYPATDKLKTQPVVQELVNAMDALSFDGIKGKEVNPAFKELHGQLGEMKAFVEGRGPDMSFADMRRLRQQLDTASQEAGSLAKVAGDKSLSAAERATMDTVNALRRQISAERPELALPNADMHLGLTVKDILNPVKMGGGMIVPCPKAGMALRNRATIRAPMRFWFIEVPALLVTLAFHAYAIFIAVMTLICFGSVIGMLLAMAL